MKLDEFHSKSSPLIRYVVAIGIFIAALSLRLLILPVESGLAFITFYPAVVLCFYLCGLGPGSVLVGLSVTAAYLFFIPPTLKTIIDSGVWIAIGLFIISSVLISFIVRKLQNYAAQLTISLSELKASENRYIDILEDQTEMLCRFKIDGTILYVNGAYCRFFGKSRESLVGYKWQPHAVIEDIPLINEKLSTLSITNPVVTIENRVISEGGNIRWGQFVNRAIFDKDGNITEMQSVSRDITQRKMLEEKLIRSNQEIQDLYDQAPCGYHSIDMNGTILRMNATELAWLGYSKDEVVGKMSIADFFSAAGRLQFQQSFAQFLRDGHIEHLNFELISRNGTIRQVDLSATAITDSEGNFLMSRSVLYDITELKKIETALRESENKFSKIFHNSPIGIGISRLTDGTFVDVNDAFLKIYEYNREDIIGRTSVELDLWVDLAYRDRIIAEVRQTGSMNGIEVEYRTKNGGNIKTLLASLEIISFGNENSLLGMVTDITERIKSEQQLRMLAQAVEQCSESIVITNLDAEIEYVNQAFEKTTGYPREEVIGKNPRLLQSGKTPLDTFVELWDSLTQGHCWKGEYINRRKDGTEYVEFAKISPIVLPTGQVVNYVETKEDITERKRIGNELNQHRHHLEDLVAARTIELLNAREAAEAANRAKTAFLANMSHEIRTPMNAIIGLAYLLNKNSTPEQEKHLKMIESSTQHLLSILNDILDISKIEAGKVDLNQVDFKLVELIEPIRLLLLAQTQSKGLKIVVDCDDVPECLNGDLTKLRQALLNYANNAVKFTEQGSISLRAKLLVDTPDHILLRFEVQDTGIGISEEKLPLMFKAFTQADVASTRQYGGSGLGLTITRSLANMMGGDAGAESKLGQGSTFWFTCRLHRSDGVTAHDTHPDAKSVRKLLRQQYSAARLLVVEDDVVNQEVILDLLHEVGLTAEIAGKGNIALEMILAGRHDLVLMDLHMPEMDSLEITRKVRELPEFANLPIIALTASVLTEDLKTSIFAGMHDYMSKPVSPELFYEKLLYWLSTSKYSRK